MRKLIKESGIRDINKLKKMFNDVVIVTHQDLDGIVSAVGMKHYFENQGFNVIDAQIAYDNELKKLGLSDWKELEEKKYYDELNAAKAEIEFFKNKGNSKLFELKESGYIYFLFKDGIIVYVGQTYSLATKRPYAHTDKSYDKIMVYEVEDKTQLNALESYLIYKLNPFYNNHPGQYGQDKLKNVLMLMEHDKFGNVK